MKLRLLTAMLSFAAATMLPAAHAQYYGGVVLSGAQARSEFGFNGSEKPSELVDLYNFSRGLTLSPEPSVGMKLGIASPRIFRSRVDMRSGPQAPAVLSSNMTDWRCARGRWA
jgi:hypothetical protein